MSVIQLVSFLHYQRTIIPIGSHFCCISTYLESGLLVTHTRLLQVIKCNYSSKLHIASAHFGDFRRLIECTKLIISCDFSGVFLSSDRAVTRVFSDVSLILLLICLALLLG